MKKAIIGLWLCLVFCVMAETASFKDDFSGYSMLSGGEPNWDIHSGKWEFINGTARHTDVIFNGGLLFLKGKSFSDCNIKVRFMPEGNKRFVRAGGVVFRARDCYNFYWIHYDCKHSRVYFAKRTTNRIWIPVAETHNITVTPDAWHTAEVSAVGPKITAKLDGKLVLEAEDHSFKEGRVGLRSGMGILNFDDFEVTGTPSDDRKFIMTYEAGEDVKTPRIQVPRVLSSVKGGYFPVMVHLGGQRLGAIIRANAGHVGISGRLDWIHSEDGGNTWSKPTVLVDSKWDDRNPAAYVTHEGKVVVIYAEASTYDANGNFIREAGTYDLFLVESADGGKTWSPKRPIRFKDFANNSVYGQGIILSNGDILVPWYWKGGGFIRSTDGGKTWQPPQRIASCSEVAFVETAPNELLAIARSSDACHTSRSLDNGKTWSALKKLTVEGIHPATVIKLKNGKLLAAFGSRVRPYGIKVAISGDNGETWPEENMAFVSWDSGNTDCGYPSAAQLDDGSVAIISYAVGSTLHPLATHSQCAILSPEILDKLSK